MKTVWLNHHATPAPFRVEIVITKLLRTAHQRHSFTDYGAAERFAKQAAGQRGTLINSIPQDKRTPR